MYIFKFTRLIFAITILHGTTWAASFDCDKAQSENEILICGSSLLSELDERYADLYHQAKAELPNSSRTREEAKDAFKRRESNCKNEICLERWYRGRINLLETVLSNPRNIADKIDYCHKHRSNTEEHECELHGPQAVQNVMAAYFNTILKLYNDDALFIQSLNKSQSTWDVYREEHCSAVYNHWRRGTIRNAKYSECEIKVTQKRTHILWEEFLTTEDSSPPYLPEPHPLVNGIKF